MYTILIYTVCLSVCLFGVRCNLNLDEASLGTAHGHQQSTKADCNCVAAAEDYGVMPHMPVISGPDLTTKSEHSNACTTIWQVKGTACEWEDVKGTCVDARRCLTTIQLRGDKHPVCSQKGGVNYVCCTDCELVNDTSNAVVDPVGGLLFKDGRKARDNCLRYLQDVPNKCSQEGYYGSISKYYNSEKQCHTYSIWAVGGAPPPGSKPPKENPYEAWLGFGNDEASAQWLTSGVIVSEKFILTSATGLATSDLPLKFVALGVNSRADKKDWQIIPVNHIFKYPQWESVEDRVRYNNIALLKLELAINFTKNVLPACLPDPTEDIDISEVKYSSWKTPEKKDNEFLDQATNVQLSPVSATTCVNKINPGNLHKYFPSGIDADQTLCFENSDACLDLVGSPVVVTAYISRCMNTVVGIHTYGGACNVPIGGPGVFTKIAHYTDWIQNVVWA